MVYNANPSKITDCRFNQDESYRCVLPMRTYTDCKYHYHRERYGKKHHLKLTDDQIINLMELYLSGLSATQAGELIGISKSSVLRHLGKYNLSRTEERSKGSKYALGEDYVPTTPFSKSVTATASYRKFKKEMMVRDGMSCVECGSTSSLHLDHIKPKALYPNLIQVPDNVRTLCSECHRKTDTYGVKAVMAVRKI